MPTGWHRRPTERCAAVGIWSWVDPCRPFAFLSDSQCYKLDGSDDALFYSEPRFVHHLDAGFRARLTQLYRERIPPCADVLDLMSSWVSHLPEDITYDTVVGHGLNVSWRPIRGLIAIGFRTSIVIRVCPWSPIVSIAP